MEIKDLISKWEQVKLDLTEDSKEYKEGTLSRSVKDSDVFTISLFLRDLKKLNEETLREQTELVCLTCNEPLNPSQEGGLCRKCQA